MYTGKLFKIKDLRVRLKKTTTKKQPNVNPACTYHIYLQNTITLLYLFIFKIVYL